MICRHIPYFMVHKELVDKYFDRLTANDVALYVAICRISEGGEIDIKDGFMGLCTDEIEECKENLRRYGIIDYEKIEGKVYISLKDVSEWFGCCQPKNYIDQQNEKDEEIRRLRSMRYSDYLKTEHWQTMRKIAYDRAGGRCQVCNTDSMILHTHHRTYVRRGCEIPEDLTVLCERCHNTFHKSGIKIHGGSR